jgi:hypothetical protein
MINTEKYLHNILDQMISTSRKLYRAKDDEAMYECHAKEMDDLRDEFFLALQRLPKDDRFVFIIDTLEANKKTECPIVSIYYGEDFAEHTEYKVYIPLLVESVEINGSSALEATGWDNIDINKIDAHEHLPKDVSWTQTVTIIN